METCNDSEEMTGSLDWVFKELVYTDNGFRVEIPGMSDVWDWSERKVEVGLSNTSEEVRIYM